MKITFFYKELVKIGSICFTLKMKTIKEKVRKMKEFKESKKVKTVK